MKEILSLVFKDTNVDFNHYKKSTLKRRVQKRIDALKLNNSAEYLIYLKKNPEEVHILFNTILIGVTDFFRDPEAFDILKKKLAHLISLKKAGDSIRIWSVGCANGSEVYTISILLHELLGDKISDYNIKIFGSDIHEPSITNARRGVYVESELKNCPREYINKYFTSTSKGYKVKENIKKPIIFSLHNLTNDPPFLRLDLISCRNLLIYFDKELQNQIFPTFHQCLNHEGYLLLGKSENIGEYQKLFDCVDATNKLFQCKKNFDLEGINYQKTLSNKSFGLHSQRQKPVITTKSIKDLAEETIIKTFDHPYVVVNQNLEILESEGSLRLYLEIKTSNSQNNLLKAVNKEIRYELHNAFLQSKKSSLPSETSVLKFDLFGQSHYVKCKIKPLNYSQNGNYDFLVIFEKVEVILPESSSISELQGIKSENELINVLKEELQVTHEHLETYRIEIEKRSAEAQALTEELQSANEELKSANEELETSNEELQALNEELFTSNSSLTETNKKLLEKEAELIDANKKANQHKKHLEIAKDIGNYVSWEMDRSTGKIRGKDELFKLFGIEDEHIDYLLKGKWMEHIHPDDKDAFLKKFIEDKSHERSEETRHKYRIYRKSDNRLIWVDTTAVTKDNKLITVIRDVTEQEEAKRLLIEEKERFKTLFNNTAFAIMIIDKNNEIQLLNDKAAYYLKHELEHYIGKNVKNLDRKNPDFISKRVQNVIKSKRGGTYEDKVTTIHGDKWFLSSIEPIIEHDGQCDTVQIITYDITEKKEAESKLAESEEKLSIIFSNISENIVLANVTEHGFFLEASNNHFFKTAAELNSKLDIEKAKNASLETVFRDILNLPDEFYLRTKYDLERVKKTRKHFHKIDEIPFPDGVHYLDTNYTPILDEQKRCKQILVTSRDVTDRVTSEKMVQDNEKKFKTILENSNESIIILDKQFRMKFVSSSHEKIFGRKAKEILGKKLQTNSHPDDKNTVIDTINKALRNPGKAFTSTVRVAHKDGTYHWIEGTARNLLHDPAVAGIVVNNRDVTERVLAEQELIESESRLKALDEATSEGIFFHANQKLIDCNSAFLRMMGYTTREEIDKLSLEEIAGPYAQLITEKIQQGYEGIYEAGLKRKNGELFPIEVTSRNTYFNGVRGRITQIKDLTERKKIEDQLAQQTQFLRTVIDAIPSFVFLKDKKGVYTLANKSVADTFNVTTDEIIGKTDEELIPHQHLVDKYLNDDNEVFKTKKTKVFIEEFYVDKNKKRYYQTTKTPIFNSQGKMDLILGISTDITDRVNTEKALFESETKFRAITEHSPYATILFDEDLNINYLSKETSKLFGDKIEEIIDSTLLQYIPESSKTYFINLLQRASEQKDKSVRFDDLHIVDSNGNSYITDGFLVKLPHESRIKGYLLKAKDITFQKQEEIKRVMLNQTILQLSNNKAIHSGDLESALRVITKTTAKVLKTSRVSVWIYDPIAKEISLALLYDNGESKYFRAGNMNEKDNKQYFTAVKQNRVVAISDVTKDKRSKPMLKDYLIPLNIKSMLDAKFIYDGKFKGVLCIEEVGEKRDWSIEEQNFIASLADLTTIIWQNHEKSLVQAALSESESQWKTLVNNAPDVIFKIDDKRRITFINKHGSNYQIEDILGMRFDQFSMPEFRSTMNKVVDNAFEHEIIGSYETSTTLKEGVKWYSSRVAPIKINGKIKEALVYTTDITERKRVEMALKEGDIRYKSMIENSTEAIWRFEIPSPISMDLPSEQQANILYESSTVAESNTLTAKLFGKSSIQDIIGKKISEFIPHSESFYQTLITFCENNYKAYELDFSLEFENGKRKYYSMYASGSLEENRLTRIWGTFKDITERKEVEFANKRLLQVLEGSTDFVGMSTIDGKALYVNTAGKKLIGHDPEADISNLLISDFHNEEMAHYMRTVAFPFAAKHGTWEGETTMTTLEGKDIPLSQLLIAHKNEEGEVLYFSTVARDMTMNKLNNERMMQSVVKGVDKERQRIASELHDSLGQLLSAASINLESMKKDIFNLPEQSQKKYSTTLSLINNAIIETREISHDLMPKSLADFGLITSLESMIEKVEHAASFDLSFSHYRVPETLDKELEINLYRITQEALNNIIKHANASSVSIQLVKHRDNLSFSIEDDGDGFEPKNTNSDGHGIANIRNRVISLGGVLTIDSKKGSGTSIMIEVPLKNN